MYKINRILFPFSIFGLSLITITGCINTTPSVSASKELINRTHSFCLEQDAKTIKEYPACTEKIGENKLCSIRFLDIHPTQFNYGKEYVAKIANKFSTSVEKTQQFLCKKPILIVIGPQSAKGFYLTDGHHRMKMLEKLINESGNEYTIVAKIEHNAMLNNPNQSNAEFWNFMLSKNEVYLKDNGVLKKPEELPKTISGLTNDPYRSLLGYIAEDKSKFCFDKKLSTYGNFAEFYWGDYFRNIKGLDKYTDKTDYSKFKNKILYFKDPKTGKRENLCLLPEAKNLPGYVQNLENHPVLVLDNTKNYQEPKSFRTAIQIEKEYKGNTHGLRNLNASGSGQFSKQELMWIMKNTSKNLVLVDLRQESHGFINGYPVTWTAPLNWANIDKTKNQAILDEAIRLKEINVQKSIEIPTAQNYKEGNLKKEDYKKFDINTVEREEQLAQSLNINYFRLTVTDHSMPTNEDVDSFISFVKNLDSKAWLHFHCRGGKGRTTTFLAMYDMLRNADSVALNDIIERQASASPYYNLLSKNQIEKSPEAKERAEFIKQFYLYAQDYKKGYAGTWSEWKKDSKNKNIKRSFMLILFCLLGLLAVVSTIALSQVCVLLSSIYPNLYP